MRSILRNTRENMRYSIRHVSEKTGLSENYLMKIELGRQSPSLENALKIYDGLKAMGMKPISIRKLFEDDGVEK